MDEYDYESDSYDEDAYDEDVDAEPFFGNLLKTQSEIEALQAKEKEEKEQAQKAEEQRKSQRIAERVSAQKELHENNDDDYVSDADNDYEEQESKVFDKRKSAKKERKCILCSTTEPKTKYFTLKGKYALSS